MKWMRKLLLYDLFFKFWVLHSLPITACKSKLDKTSSELKITAGNISCLQQKHNTMSTSDLVIREFNPKLARLAFGLTGA